MSFSSYVQGIPIGKLKFLIGIPNGFFCMGFTIVLTLSTDYRL
jgi:hypothetical protein